MVNRQTPPRLASASRRPSTISVRVQRALEVLAERLANLLPPPSEKVVPIRIRDSSDHRAPKWRSFS